MHSRSRAERSDSVRLATDSYSELTEGEWKIADCVIAHAATVADLSARDLGAKGRAAYDDYVVDLDASGRDLEQTVRRVALAGIHEIRSTAESLDLRGLERAARKIASCWRLCFFGFGTSAVVCEDAVLKFSRLGIPSLACSDPHVCASAHGAWTMAVSTYLRVPLATHRRMLQKTMTRESPMHSAAIISRMSQLAVVDPPIMAVASAMRPRALGRLARVSATLKAFRT